MTNPLKYTCLFGGGAIRGMAYIGTIRALEELGIEYDIIGGSSVGSIMAALVASGYKSYELENLFMKVNFDLFKDIHLGIGKAFAISKGEIFQDWLNELLSNKNDGVRNRNVTFKDIDKQLVIITTNLTKFCNQEFSGIQTPDFEVAQAIKISSSMPGLMAPYKYNECFLVDGDLQKASPMWRLSETLNNSESRILEFRLEGDYSKDEKNPISFINTIYSCVTDIATDFVTELYGQNDRYDCIRINTGDIFFADFNLSKDERRKLIETGYKQTMDYFNNVLPQKKQKLADVYLKILICLKKALKGLKANNVEEVQWWFGDIFTILCENKEIVDPVIYKKILDLKISLTKGTATVLFFHTCFKGAKRLEAEMKDVIMTINSRINDLKLYLQNFSESGKQDDKECSA